MLDIGLLRSDPERVRRSALRRGHDASFVDRALDLDERLRAALTSVERLKAQKNELSAQVAKATDKAAAAAELRPKISDLDGQIAAAGAALPGLVKELEDELAGAANVLDDSVPDGTGEGDNVIVRASGSPRRFDFEPKQHVEIGEALGILDFERAAKLSGARFAMLRGRGAQLSRAIINFFLSRAAECGYVEICPPVLVSRATMWATGQLTKFADAMFMDQEAGLYMIPTAEVPLTAMHREEILGADELPRLYAAHTPCFRKEAGAAGKDTRGLIRLHQFDKVELVWLAEPEQSFAALEQLTEHAEALLQELGLACRVSLLCSADTGFSSAKTHDLEVWLPGQNMYREISSCSNCTDFQARRCAIRFRRDAKAKPEPVHTLNGSGLAVGRTLVAILENYQERDGSVRIPEALIPFCGFDRIDAPDRP